VTLLGYASGPALIRPSVSSKGFRATMVFSLLEPAGRGLKFAYMTRALR
jgi:hypothetical protein